MCVMSQCMKTFIGIALNIYNSINEGRDIELTNKELYKKRSFGAEAMPVCAIVKQIREKP